MRHLYAWLALFFTLVTSNVNAASEIWVVPVKGAIGPAISDYLVREIELSNAEGADLVICLLYTSDAADDL